MLLSRNEQFDAPLRHLVYRKQNLFTNSCLKKKKKRKGRLWSSLDDILIQLRDQIGFFFPHVGNSLNVMETKEILLLS